MGAPLARARGLVGLTLLGEGLFILFRVVPHETPLLGAALALAGAALLWRADLPRLDRLSPTARAAAAIAGLAAAGGLLAYDAWRRAPLDPPKTAIVALGLATALAAAASRPGRRWSATALAWSAPTAWAPLAVWAAQGAMAATMGGRTLLDGFVAYGLLLPMSAVLALLGRSPTVAGQVITYSTPRGPLALQVGVACSGLQAMALFGGVVALYLLLERPPPRVAAVWSTVGLLGVYVVNVVRLVTLALVGYRWGSDALETAHANAGWLFFVAWAGLFSWMAFGRAARRQAPGSA